MRGYCPANGMLQNKEWPALADWVTLHIDDPAIITMTSHEDGSPPRSNILTSLDNFRMHGSDGDHARASAAIVGVLYNEGLIHLQVGLARDTALLRSISNGNYDTCSLLLQYGAGIPLWLICGSATRNVCPGGSTCIVRLGLVMGESGV